MKPTPEEKCSCFCHTKGFAGDITQHHCCSPSPDARVDWETLARQLHEWYLEATLDLDPLNYNANAQKDYDALSEEQKFIDRFIAKKILAAFEKGREAR